MRGAPFDTKDALQNPHGFLFLIAELMSTDPGYLSNTPFRRALVSYFSGFLI